MKKGTLLIDSSTIDPAVSKEMAVTAEKMGAVFMDAPVTGGRDCDWPWLNNKCKLTFDWLVELISSKSHFSVSFDNTSLKCKSETKKFLNNEPFQVGLKINSVVGNVFNI